MQTKDHKRHLEAAWKAAAEAAKQLERLREQMLSIDRYDKAKEASKAAACCRDWCRGIYNASEDEPKENTE